MSDRVPPAHGIITLEVRRSDFLGAMRQDNTACVLARAIERVFPDAEGVYVYTSRAKIDGWWWKHDALGLVCNFDDGVLTHENAPPVSVVTLTRAA